MINPFFMFIAAFSAVIFSFFFGWSSIYPSFSNEVIFFFLVMFLLAGVLGYFVKKSGIVVFKKISSTTNVIWLLVLVLAGTLFEGIYNKGFPLQFMLQGRDSGYTEFGIPTVHVILLTLTAFLTTFLFHLVLSSTGKLRLEYIGLCLASCIPYILEVNRGMFMMVMLNCVTIFMLAIWKKIKIWHIVGAGVFFVIFMFLFGVMGNARVNTSYQNGRSAFDSASIMQIGGATEKFKDSRIPKEFFWTYIYASSPIANFQKTVTDGKAPKKITVPRVNRMIFGELIPDFIGKRALANSKYKSVNIQQITPELNVGTALSKPYLLLGWFGVAIYVLFIFGLAYVYLYFLYKLNSRFFIVGLAVLNTIFILAIYSNMVQATGLSFQLLYPIFFALMDSYAEYKNKLYLRL
ncbi:oligosaccharide repeat unit polymerase [Latilactobacillus curvatus]|uniref:oligosaccharide repeat unit polymerase n=1 Tax=Latilactobacillus curvatus TaxID=28038 RepID=UPI0009766018|nr:oligosaccharide repeat unit polymerase [Latilactobacillus curvatus]MCT1215314.1 oligosaccharide repeat unit polymerase [Latilactobacillus curvatus]WRS45787.1 oligosaccharide repeat unit polymerase [Latilactobacillus curvatus]